MSEPTPKQTKTKREGDISDAFVSLSGAKRVPLPDRFRQLKCDLVRGREEQLTTSWKRLLRSLQQENEIIARKGSDVIPQVEYAHLESGVADLKSEILKRGVVVVRGVVPEAEARAYKEQVEDYVHTNPWTRGKYPICRRAQRMLTLAVQPSRPTTPKYTSCTGLHPSSRLAPTLPSCTCSSTSCHPSGTCLPLPLSSISLNP